MSTALTLYNMEGDFLALLESADLVAEDQRVEYNQQLHDDLALLVEKRDRMAGFLRHCELMQDNCAAEIRRLQNLKQTYASGEKRGREYVKHVIASLGVDDDGKFRALEGKTCRFSLRHSPASVAITDVDALPDSYMMRSVKLNDEQWGLIRLALTDHSEWALIEALSVGFRESQPVPDKEQIKKDLRAGNIIPGADLNIEETHVELR